jgi:hypothetical protein
MSLLSCGDVEANPGPPKAPPVRKRPLPSAGQAAAPPGELAEPLDLAHWQDAAPPLRQLDQAGNACAASPPTVAPRQLPQPLPFREVLGTRAPTVAHMPAALQRLVSAEFARTIADYCDSPDYGGLFSILAFPKLVMRAPKLAGRNAATHAEAAIQDRLNRFIGGDVLGLTLELLKEHPVDPPGTSTRAAKRARLGSDEAVIAPEKLRRIRQLLAEGAPRKALDVLTSRGSLDPTDPTVLAALRRLHPDSGDLNLDDFPEATDPGIPDADPGFWEPLVREAILGFPRGSAAGPSGLRPSHLQDAVRRRGGGAVLVKAIARLTSLWVHGRLPLSHGPLLCGANLTPLAKTDPTAVRPVAVGETLRRTVGKALLATARAKAEVESLQPIQVGVGVPGAAEAVAMGVQSITTRLKDTPGWTLLKVDLRNAFNSIDRANVLREAALRAPSTFNFLRFAYGAAAPLYVGSSVIPSATGTHQGCPLGPVGFALGIQPILERIARTGGLVWSSWYLDDGVLIGPTSQVAQALRLLRPAFQAAGLEVNLSKCEAWGPDARALTEQFPEIHFEPWEPDTGTVILGSPVDYPGTTGFTTKYWAAIVDKLEEALDHLSKLTDSQAAHYLLRSCLDGCRVNHLLRASDTYADGGTLAEVFRADTLIEAAFSRIVGSPLTPAQWKQACQPFSAGGCGVRSPVDVRPAARIAALAAFHTKGARRVGLPSEDWAIRLEVVSPVLQDLRAHLGANFDPLRGWMAHPDRVATAEAPQLRQHWWSEALGKRQMLRLLDHVSPRDQHRLIEQSNSIGTVFMSVRPSASAKTTIPTDTYRLGLRFWLGMPVVEASSMPLSCPSCRADVDEHGDHMMCCRHNNFTRRHAAVQEGLAVLLREARQPFDKEVGFPGEGAGGQRAADIFIPCHEGGRDVAIDVTVEHGWKVAEQRDEEQVASRPDATRERWRGFLVRAERKKVDFYKVACDRAGWRFRPMAFGTWGGQGPEAARLLHHFLARATCWCEPDQRAGKMQELRQQFGLALMRQVWALLEPAWLLC